MLDVLHVAVHGQVSQRTDAHLEFGGQGLALIVVLLLHADPGENGHADDMQDIVLVALALPVFDVQVSPLR
ncbi:hypothetical protein D3C79_728580 [compost metagenome]